MRVPTLLNHTVDVAPAPGSSTTGGASAGPQMLTRVVPYGVGTSTPSTVSGHFASTASYASRKADSASAERNVVGLLDIAPSSRPHRVCGGHPAAYPTP